MDRALDPNYEALAKAIVTSAAEDYKRSRFIIETIDKRKFQNETSKKAMLSKAQREVTSVELFFFKSEWFKTLSGLDGEKAFAVLQETYISEYYPARMSDHQGKDWTE